MILVILLLNQNGDNKVVNYQGSQDKLAPLVTFPSTKKSITCCTTQMCTGQREVVRSHSITCCHNKSIIDRSYLCTLLFHVGIEFPIHLYWMTECLCLKKTQREPHVQSCFVISGTIKILNRSDFTT